MEISNSHQPANRVVLGNPFLQSASDDAVATNTNTIIITNNTTTKKSISEQSNRLLHVEIRVHVTDEKQ